ncbi:MAG: hypothetical protein MAG453_00524 [Calditrichaeota bacterium]|nr:hypothetical protein [Calditrichota bacterium]
MSEHRLRLGARGERIAEKYLRRKGYRIAARNLRRRAGEIDRLMWDGDELVIVEVRTVRESGPVTPEERVPMSKRRQLSRLARHLVSRLEEPLPPVRIDVCVVVMEPDPEVLHFKHAFLPDPPRRRRR